MRFSRPFVLVATVTWLVACGNDTIKTCDPNVTATIKGTITYSGTSAITRLAVAVFDVETNPPQTMPVAMGYFPESPVAGGITFPAAFELSGVPACTSWYMVYGDVDPDDGPLPKVNIDPTSEWVGPVSLSAADPLYEKDLTLEDGRWQGLDEDVMGYFDGVEPEVVDDVTADPGSTPDVPADVSADLTPKAGKATLHGTVTYAGTKTGKLVVIGFKDTNFDTVPTIMPPFTAESASFPFEYAITSVGPATKAVFAYLDIDPDDGLMTNSPTDPISATATVDLAAGDIERLDLVIVDP